MATKKAVKAKKQANTTRFIVYDNHLQFEIVGETDKYWLCEGTQFRKTNPRISIMEVVEAEPIEDEKESDGE